ncbi:MAG TPA: glycosyltransferase family 2 protein [Acidimicrobiales bacterium]
MYRDHTVSVYFPCRNEEAHLRQVVAQVPTFVDEIIVVSNRSTDGTVELSKSLDLTVLVDDRTSGGIGYGYAHMTGMAACSGDLIVTSDADGSYPVDQIHRPLDRLVDDGMDFVSCSRYPVPEGSTIPWALRAGVRLLNTETRLLFGRRVKDVLSGMWALRATARPHLALDAGDWNLSPGIKVHALRSPALRFAEVPIAQRPRLGQSHQRYLSTGFSHAGFLLRTRLGTYPGSPLDHDG